MDDAALTELELQLLLLWLCWLRLLSDRRQPCGRECGPERGLHWDPPARHAGPRTGARRQPATAAILTPVSPATRRPAGDCATRATLPREHGGRHANVFAKCLTRFFDPL